MLMSKELNLRKTIVGASGIYYEEQENLFYLL